MQTMWNRYGRGPREMKRAGNEERGEYLSVYGYTTIDCGAVERYKI